jgi:hypothetical protein
MAAAAKRGRRAGSATPRSSVPRAQAVRIGVGTRSIPDNSTRFVAVAEWLGSGDGAAESQAEHLIAANRGLLRDVGVTADVTQRGGQIGLSLCAASQVGAVPLLSPVSGRADLGLVVEPRFPWTTAGDVMAGTGGKVVPTLLALPTVPRSERRVPPWVLSSVVLARVRALLAAMQRRFVVAEASLLAPKGQVNWTRYATTRFACGQVLSLPCRFPDLREDSELTAAMHWVVRRHRESLRGQGSGGRIVRRLLADCEELLMRLGGVSPQVPSPSRRAAWHQHPLSTRVFRDGLAAIDWTVEERGLGGLSELSGLAWRLDMEAFFEAWVETLADHASRLHGAQLRAGRTSATKVPLDWRPASTGSQRSLVPDVVMQRSDVVVVLDAKYKRHAQEIERLGWTNVDESLREQHRNDVLQALAYSTLFDAPRVVACLVYPAAPDVWQALVDRGRDCMRARVRSGARHVEIALLAVPMGPEPARAGGALTSLLNVAV